MILDASAAVPMVIAHENATSARALATRATFAAPSLLLVEVANTLWRYAMRDGFGPDGVAAGLEQVGAICTTIVPSEKLLPHAIDLAVANRHSVHDCLYLALAIERREPLATADRKLADLAQRLGVDAELISPAL